MKAFTQLTAIAAPLPLVNIDTDMIIPKQFLKTIVRDGLGRYLFHELRTRPDGSENPDFVLNKPAFRQARILIAGANFGCGSSREHAPWALRDYGITCVIAASFADIFHGNCFKNGILPVTLPQQAVDHLAELTARGREITVDLEQQSVTAWPENLIYNFQTDPFRRECLLKGLDDIDLTLQHGDTIANFERQRAHWL